MIARPTTRELLHMLTANDSRLVKHAIQSVCDLAETGRGIDLNRDLRFQRLLTWHKDSPDRLVRRWLYKFAGLAGTRGWSAWTGAQLAGREGDPENVTWAFAAHVALEGRFSAAERASRGGHDPTSPALRLSGDYFRDGLPVDTALLRTAMSLDDRLTHRWLGLRRGRDPRALPAGVLADLTGSADPITVEYAVWATHRDPRGYLRHLPICPSDLPNLVPNVRRWYLRLLLKETANATAYPELLDAAMFDPEPGVREGLALGLLPLAPDPYLVESVCRWFERERDALARPAVARLMSRHVGSIEPYRQLLAHAAQNDSSVQVRHACAGSDRSEQPKILVPTTRKQRRQAVLDAVPTITRTFEENVCVLGVDTVKFSLMGDGQQLTIFRDLLDALHNDDLVSRMEPTDLACILTGDGLWLGFRRPADRLAPVKVALRLRASFHRLRCYSLRFGINNGPAAWIEFAAGGPQLISHTINWTARVMAAASDDEILISDQYYQTHLRGSLDRLPEARFERQAPKQTKHGEELIVWSAIDKT